MQIKVNQTEKINWNEIISNWDDTIGKNIRKQLRVRPPSEGKIKSVNPYVVSSPNITPDKWPKKETLGHVSYWVNGTTHMKNILSWKGKYFNRWNNNFFFRVPRWFGNYTWMITSAKKGTTFDGILKGPVGTVVWWAWRTVQLSS